MVDKYHEPLLTLEDRSDESSDDENTLQEDNFLDLCNDSQSPFNTSTNVDDNWGQNEFISRIHTAKKDAQEPLDDIYMYHHWFYQLDSPHHALDANLL